MPAMAPPQDDKEEKKEEPPKYWRVKCPTCKELPAAPCKFVRTVVRNDGSEAKFTEIDYFAVHITRVVLYEAFAQGIVNETGMGKNGVVFHPTPTDAVKETRKEKNN